MATSKTAKKTMKPTRTDRAHTTRQRDPDDMIIKRACLPARVADRAELWRKQRQISGEFLPTMEITYGVLIEKALDALAPMPTPG